MKVGIDAGGTLIKIVQEQDNQRTFKTELTKNIDQVVEWLNQQQIEKLCLTEVMQVLLLKTSTFLHKFL